MSEFPRLRVAYRDDEQFMCMTVIVPDESWMETANTGRLSDDPNRDDVLAIVYHQVLPTVGLNVDPDESDELAVLFAAAPDLLEAAQMAYEDLEGYEYTDLPGGYAVMATVQALRAAIAKATGEPCEQS